MCAQDSCLGLFDCRSRLSWNMFFCRYKESGDNHDTRDIRAEPVKKNMLFLKTVILATNSDQHPTTD